MSSREQKRVWWEKKSLAERQALGSARRKILRQRRQLAESKRNIILARVLDSPVSIGQLMELCGVGDSTVRAYVRILSAESDIFARKWEENKRAKKAKRAK